MDRNLMKQKLKYDNTKYYRLAFELILSFVLFLVIYLVSGFWFETNDDINIYSILSGKYTGTPDFHTFHTSVVYSFPVSVLYRVIPTVPWHGILILIFQFASCVIPLHAASTKCKSYKNYAIVLIAYIFTFLGSWYLRSRIQYTSTGLLLAGAGFICLFLFEKKKDRVVFFTIFEVLAYILRPETMELIQPLGLAMLAGLTVSGQQYNRKKTIQKIVPYLCISIIIVIVGTAADKVSYGTEEYEQAVSLHEARIKLFDYYGFPDTEEITPILNEYGVYAQEYEAFRHYAMPEVDRMSGAIEKIAEYVTQNENISVSIPNIVKSLFYDSYRHDYLYKTNLVTITAWLVALCTIFMYKRYRYGFAIFAYFIGKMFSWGYVFYQGRIPTRILFPLYVFEIMSALTIAVYVCNESKKDERKITANVLTGLMLILLLGATVFSAKLQTDYLVPQKDSFRILQSCEQTINDYCTENPDKKYILSQMNYMYWQKEPWDTLNTNENDILYEGGWFATLPSFQKKVDEFFEVENLYLITTSEDDIRNDEFAYYEIRFGQKPEKTDEFMLPTGVMAEVFRIK